MLHSETVEAELTFWWILLSEKIWVGCSGIMPFLLVLLWNEVSISDGFRDIQWWLWCNVDM